MEFLGAFEQRGPALTVVGENHLQAFLASGVEAAKDGARAIEDLHLLLRADLHADREQRLLVAPPLTRCKSKPKNTFQTRQQ